MIHYAIFPFSRLQLSWNLSYAFVENWQLNKQILIIDPSPAQANRQTSSFLSPSKALTNLKNKIMTQNFLVLISILGDTQVVSIPDRQISFHGKIRHFEI